MDMTQAMKFTHSSVDLLHLGSDHDMRLGLSIGCLFRPSCVDHLGRQTQDRTDGDGQPECNLVRLCETLHSLDLCES
jgi:hypothetical protein